jgi:GNAT superfamily N-acetyltransferase
MPIQVRTMRESDVPEARRICSVAFGTFLGAPDPPTFMSDRDMIGTRWQANPTHAFVAEVDGVFAGSNLATNWGSFAFFGPLTIRPEYWNRGIAQALLSSTMDLFQSWNLREAGLFTFPHSPKHINLYQKFGFWPGFLTAVMSKPPQQRENISWSKYSQASEADRPGILRSARELTDRIFEGLDVTGEIRAVQEQALGDTVLISGDTLDGFAICHCGEGTEAGKGSCFIKFAAVRPGPGAESSFARLLGACESFALERGLRRVEAGVNMGRIQAYRSLLRQGYRTDMQGVAMHRSDSSALIRPDVYVLDDWR